MKKGINNCGLCGCVIQNNGGYAEPTVDGRSHRTKHHYVAERFFGRSNNRRGEIREGIFSVEELDIKPKFGEYCYDCHEELLHNPIILKSEMDKLAEIFKIIGANEDVKTERKDKLKQRIITLKEVIRKGIDICLSELKP